MAQAKHSRHRVNRKDRPISLQELTSQARAHGPSMIKVLQGLATSPKVPPAARTAAANSILDRGWGKPAQAIQIKGDPDSPVIFNLRLSDGMVNGGQARLEPTPDSLGVPLVAVAVEDEGE